MMPSTTSATLALDKQDCNIIITIIILIEGVHEQQYNCIHIYLFGVCVRNNAFLFCLVELVGVWLVFGRFGIHNNSKIV